MLGVQPAIPHEGRRSADTFDLTSARPGRQLTQGVWPGCPLQTGKGLGATPNGTTPTAPYTGCDSRRASSLRSMACRRSCSNSDRSRAFSSSASSRAASAPAACGVRGSTPAGPLAASLLTRLCRRRGLGNDQIGPVSGRTAGIREEHLSGRAGALVQGCSRRRAECSHQDRHHDGRQAGKARCVGLPHGISTAGPERRSIGCSATMPLVRRRAMSTAMLALTLQRSASAVQPQEEATMHVIRSLAAAAAFAFASAAWAYQVTGPVLEVTRHQDRRSEGQGEMGDRQDP